MDSATRTKKTPAERAEEALGVAVRLRKRHLAKLEAAKAEVRRLEGEREPLDKRVEYAAANPDLTPEDRERHLPRPVPESVED